MAVNNEHRSKPDLVERLWSSDAASALTNEAARAIERLRRALLFDCMHFGHSETDAQKMVANVEAGTNG